MNTLMKNIATASDQTTKYILEFFLREIQQNQ